MAQGTIFMTISRRLFLRNTSLAVIGGIFVPKFERWFRPNPIYQSSWLMEWPEHQPGDVVILMMESAHQQVAPPGWTEVHNTPMGDLRAFWQRAINPSMPRVQVFTPQARMMTFRGAVRTGDPFDQNWYDPGVEMQSPRFEQPVRFLGDRGPIPHFIAAQLRG